MRQKVIYDKFMEGQKGAIEPPRITALNKWVNLAVKNLEEKHKNHQVHPYGELT